MHYTAASMKRLVLFDIDGTLIRDSGAAREAYSIALRETYGFERGVADYDFSGKTDPEITFMVLGDAGFAREEIEAKFSRLWDVYLTELEQRADLNHIRALEGAHALLDELDADPDILLALLTGNIEPGARIKLAPPQLNHYFAFGAFGSDDHRRAELPPIAMARASERFGVEIRERDVVIIGDSIFDIRCGVPHNATTVAVSTGRTDAETLRGENPDFLFDSLEPSEELLRAIRGF